MLIRIYLPIVLSLNTIKHVFEIISIQVWQNSLFEKFRMISLLNSTRYFEVACLFAALYTIQSVSGMRTSTSPVLIA